MRNLIDKIEKGLTQDEYYYILSQLNCCVIEVDLPMTVRGLTMKNDDGYMVYVNSLMNERLMRRALKHELLHIYDEDFAKEGSLLEKEMKVMR